MIDFDVTMQVEDEEEMVGRPMRDGGLDGTGDGGAVNVQPDQGQPVVNWASASLSCGQVQERRHGSEDNWEEADGT